MSRARNRIRTDDLRFTKPLHYRCAILAIFNIIILIFYFFNNIIFINPLNIQHINVNMISYTIIPIIFGFSYINYFANYFFVFIFTKENYFLTNFKSRFSHLDYYTSRKSECLTTTLDHIKIVVSLYQHQI